MSRQRRDTRTERTWRRYSRAVSDHRRQSIRSIRFFIAFPSTANATEKRKDALLLLRISGCTNARILMHRDKSSPLVSHRFLCQLLPQLDVTIFPYIEVEYDFPVKFIILIVRDIRERENIIYILKILESC